MKQFFISLFIISFIHSKVHSQVTKEIEPSWIDNINYSKSEINKDDIEAGSYVLLCDTQINIPKQTEYNRLTTLVTDNVGIQNVSTINVSYDPSYQKLKFHKINIIRNNTVINKLNISDIQVMRRELNAENHLYDGSLSAIIHLTDVRTDDIIDYAYSIVGFNPIHKNIFSNHFYFNAYQPYGKINVTLLSPKKLNYKPYNTNIKPTISNLNNSYKYNWVITNTKKLDYEEYMPDWKLIHETILISEFNSWKEVIDWGIDVFKISQPLDIDLIAKINQINNLHSSNGEKIKATLNFVQNEIRYLGLESGIGSYKPFSPNQVFKQRFGDCKDKSLLMVAMLNKMNIEAYPMLVNTSLKQNIKSVLPTPKIFNHCVVKVTDGRNYYYDPTISNQGGEYDSTHFPNYGYGLVLKKDNETFDEISPYSENKIEILEEFTIKELGKGATLKVVTMYHEAEADGMRLYFKNNSISSIEKEYIKFYSNYYYNVTATKQIRFEDKLSQNVFKVYEEYKLDSIWKPMVEKENHIAANFLPTSFLDVLYFPTKDKRNSELSIIYPIIREHKIKVNLPTDWNIESERLYVNSPGFYYEWKVDYNKNEKVMNLYYYIKTLKDHINKNEYKQYIQDVNKVDQTTSYLIYVPKNFSSSTTTPTSGNNLISIIKTIFKFSIIICGLIVLALIIFWFLGKQKNKA